MEEYIKVIGQFDRELVVDEINGIFDADQFCLQGIEPGGDPLYGARAGNEMDHDEDEFVFPNFHLPYTNSLLTEYGLHRARVMKLPPKSCLTYHTDPSKRVHFPLLSNDDCFFIIEDQMMKMPLDGSVILTDTTKRHTAVNASTKYRTHIIGCRHTDISSVA